MHKTDAFKHPGLFIRKEDVPSIENHIKTVPIVKKAYDALVKATPIAYVPKPHAVLDIGWNEPTIPQAHNDLMNDAQQSYMQAQAYLFAGDERHAQNALDIVNAWATTNVRATGRNMPLEFAWSHPSFARTLELLKYTYPKYAQLGTPVEKAYLHWLDSVVMPLLTQKLSFVNNWVVTMTEARMQIAILRNDLAAFNDCIDAYRKFLPQVIEPSGLPQEVRRDLCHTQFTLGSLVAIAQLAANQGVNLYMESGGLLLKALETTASILLGEHPDAAKGIELKQVSFHPVNWEVAYGRYTNNEHVPMPKTAQLLKKYRPEWVLWNWGGSTLTHYTHE